MKLCNNAIGKDPNLCDPYTLKARRIYGNICAHEYCDQRRENEVLFHDLAFQAYSLYDENHEAVSICSMSFNIKKDYHQRLKYAKQALALNPSHTGSTMIMAKLCVLKSALKRPSYTLKEPWN